MAEVIRALNDQARVLNEHGRILVEHGHQLERLTDAVREEIGVKGQQP